MGWVHKNSWTRAPVLHCEPAGDGGSLGVRNDPFRTSGPCRGIRPGETPGAMLHGPAQPATEPWDFSSLVSTSEGIPGRLITASSLN